MQRSVGGVLAVAMLATISGIATAPAAWATPPPLTGEFLSAGSTSLNGGTLVTSATCSQTSPSTIAFTASGTVPSGYPYPGPFTESGVVTISTIPSGTFVNGVPFYEISALDAFFTIDSAVGEVTGTKHLAQAGVYGLCDTFSGETFGNTGDTVTGFFREVNPSSDGFGESYDALITTSGGTFEDTGVSGLLFDDLNLSAVSGPVSIQNSNTLNDFFRSNSLTAVSGVGDATGGGQISPSGTPISFGFEARSHNGLKGQCDVVDQAAAVKVHCSDVTAWAQVSPTEVDFFGNAIVNGSPTSYSIVTKDVADPGIGSDTFTITTGTGYRANGTLARGNVQIHNH